MRATLLLAGVAAMVTGILGGCSDTGITAVGDGVTIPAQSKNDREDKAGPEAIGKVFAEAALDDRELSGIRGGLSVGSGLVLNFAFQESTFVNNNLTQNVVVPTITVSPGSSTATVAGAAVQGGGISTFSPGSVAVVGNLATPVSSPAVAVQSILNNGMTSIVTNIGAAGVSNVISNTANNQLVQQLITANINISGFSQAIRQSVASTVIGRVQAATSQFH